MNIDLVVIISYLLHDLFYSYFMSKICFEVRNKLELTLAYAECSTGKKNLFCQLNACIAAFRTSNRMFFVMSHVKKSNVTSDKILSDLMHIRLLCMILT